MNPRAKNYLIIVLAFATVTAGTIAWRQHQQLESLQADLLTARSGHVRKAPAPKVAPTGNAPASVAVAPKPAEDETAAPVRQQRNNRPNFSALMNNPEAVKAWNLQQRAQLDGRFAALFKQLNLSPVQLDNLKNLLVERQSAAMEIYATARDKGLDPNANRDDIRKLVAESQAEVDQSIKAALGETGYQQYQNYENTQPQRAVVNQLDQRLSYSATPLTSAQSDFLVQALSTPASGATTTDQANGGGPWNGRGGGVTITDAVIQQAQNILVPDQVAALKQIQAEQQALQKLGQLMRGTTNATGGGGGRQRGN